MRLLIYTLILICTFQKSYAQSSENCEFGTFFLSVGYGAPNINTFIYKSGGNKTNFSSSSVGPVHFKIGLGLGERFDVLFNINATSFKSSWMQEEFQQSYNYSANVSSVATLLRGNIHFNEKNDFDKLDLYAGLGVGRNYYQINRQCNNPHDNEFSKQIMDNTFSIEATVGGRLYFSKYFGAYAEVGYAKSIVQIGLIYKKHQ